MPGRRRIVRRTLGKEPRMMSRTLITDDITGTASLIEIVSPTINAGGVGTGDVLENADTAKIVSPNSIIKYINIRFQSGLRDVAPRSPGFVEYAVVIFEEQQSLPTLDAIITAGMGTQTVGDLCTNLYRGNCIWQGAFAISEQVPGVLDLKIKIPNKWCKMKRGMYIMLVKGAHTVDVSDVTTDFRTFLQVNYKCYL